ncbi:MAG: DNA mismatch repair protein MutS [Porphyromonadaceae bacterium]|nr:DNA mismatch repair protein MutS [Porphyromonadaceae bacterium]
MAKKHVETPLMKQYYSIKDQHPDAILLFRIGDFYETFGDDAIMAAEILGITLTKRANGAASAVELAGFPHHALDNYLPKLVRAGKRVAICDQLEDPKLAKKIVKRGITELVTPGLVMGDSVLKNKENNYLASVHLSSGDMAGLALLDISTGEFLCAEGSTEHINKLIESYQPRELLLERKQRRLVLEQFSGTDKTITELDDWSFSTENSRSRLLEHFGVQSLKGFGVEHLPLGIVASGAILSYLEITSHHQIGHITSLRAIDRTGFMRLDAFTLRNLEIISAMNPTEGKSLLDVVDYTRTPMGGRLLRNWLLFPLIDRAAIEQRLETTAELYADSRLRLELADLLGSIGDLERLVSKAAVGRISPREVNQLEHSLCTLGQIQDLIAGESYTQLSALVAQLDRCRDLCTTIERTLVPDAPMALGRGAVIAPGVDAELDELRELSSGGKDYIQRLQQRESERTGIPNLKISFNNIFGYYLEVRNTHKDKVPAEWIRRQTLTSAERYIIPELKEYEDKILGAEGRIAIIESRIFSALISELAQHIRAIQRNSQIVARLDCLASFAEVAQRCRYVRPTLEDSTTLSIKQGRHPVIESQLPLGQAYIPNDIYLDTEETQIVIITGPNMSGKSALLRQTALIVLLAQIGSFVPAEAATLGVTDAIFTRVGASDNISRGESTFMVEMQEASSILNNLTPRSLILFDELGRGTSTYDGISIAWSIVEYLHETPQGRAKTLFATHYHELNDLEHQLARVKNFNVSAQEIDGKMLFLRKLVPGGSEHSFGIQVARLGGMPPIIVERATEILRALERQHAAEPSAPAKGHKRSARSKQSKGLVEVDLTGVQMSFFQLDDPVLSQIRDLLLQVDINNLTPLEALNKLSDIQSLLK